MTYKQPILDICKMPNQNRNSRLSYSKIKKSKKEEDYTIAKLATLEKHLDSKTDSP